MKVVLNLTCINNSPSGARNRIKHLYYYLIKNNPEISFFILEPKDSNIQNLFIGCVNIKFIKTNCLSYNSLQRYFMGLFSIPKIIKKINPDIYEQFHLPLIKVRHVNTICTIHDIRYSTSLSSLKRPKFISNFLVKKAIYKSTKIITVSKSLKDDLIKLSKSDNIEYVYNVFDSNNYNFTNNNKNKYKFFDQDFILSVGVFEERKNYIKIIESAYILKKIYPNIKFIIVGAKTKFASFLLEKIKLLELNEEILFLHDISDNELIELYRKAKLFLFPSKYEGFGIPVLEAIQQNCKIILSNIDVFKEITNNKLTYFDKTSSEDLTFHILNALSKKVNPNSNYILSKETLDNFTPKKISSQIINIYNSCVV